MIVEAINLNKSFDDKKVLDDISLSLEEGNITGLVGRNGSGKTTLLKILAGIYNADSGKFKISGYSLNINPKTIEHIAYLPDRFEYFNYDNIKDIPDFYKIIYPKFDEEFFFNEIEKNKFDLNQTIRNFSKGEKNLLGLITVLATNAEVILTDEILDGMDVLNKRRIIQYLLDARDKGCAVFSSSHELSELSGICDSIYYLTKDGKISLADDNESQKINKVQVVVNDILSERIKNQSVIISHIGRVYTILIDMDKKDVDELLNTEEIVQYDYLEMKLEDYFYLEEGAHNE
ncbi:ABC transporter ATP-binding protein [uncultured Anaerococcus sp.]|uniref:ATP-binding cassette domain-containing protein n=1 Tax=uncultured Anaerococcus sp. TaxID=293428 RepID=UPI002629FC18|nr:ABC transporter ATP-binding protein [uncultured Anaerococcus sp.]